MTHLLDSRKQTHGDFVEQFRISQELKEIIRDYQFNTLSDVHKEALEMILMKVSRIVAGDAHHADHWQDIAGYAMRSVEWMNQFNDK